MKVQLLLIDGPKCRRTLWFPGVISCVAMMAVFAVPASALADAPKPLPDFKEVEAVVRTHVKMRPGYRPNDILSQSDVKRVLDGVEKLGWKIADRKAIIASALGDGDYLVQQLRSRNGVPFMRKLSGTQGAYDRLDQLRRLKYGNRRIRELIQSPGGHTLILYMTNTKGGKNLNRQLRQTKNGRNFGKPTKRIYTGSDLLAQLRESYRAEEKRRSPIGVKGKPRSKTVR